MGEVKAEPTSVQGHESLLNIYDGHEAIQLAAKGSGNIDRLGLVPIIF